ncbi:MAG TPA: type I-D CRISPR-associated helicase Cas3' [Ktedonobacteraceae bacterium]
MQFMVEEVRYAQLATPFVNGLKPYMHQVQTRHHIREAIEHCRTICIENTSITGSGKTLANFAAAILDGIPTCGIYPTNELMIDQGVSLDPYLRQEITLLDSQGLTDIQAEQAHMRTHAHALDWVTGDQIPLAILTNPDVLYLAMYNLYGQMFSTFASNYGNRVFQNILANYPVIAFDEFHLYNAKQIANAAFLMGTMKELAPNKPHIFIFSSATPQEQFKQYAQRLDVNVLSVGDVPSTAPDSRVVCEQLHIHLLAADLLRWKGGDVIRENLPTILRWAESQSEQARGVFIVDSVYEAKRIAADLRQRGYPLTDIGEVHGYMAPENRRDALLLRFSVGTTTIDVGVDLTGQKSKDFLVCEARSAAQAIQRIGRLGRHGREAKNIPIPNMVWLVVPEYVYNYIGEQSVANTMLTRERLNALLTEAYPGHENFLAYTRTYAPLEAIAACERILRPQHFSDTIALASEKMHHLVPTLYNVARPATQELTEDYYIRQRKRQKAVWRKFGVQVKGTHRTDHFFLSDLESFRGGMESDCTVAVYDELDQRLGFRPVKTYDLPFLMRRTQYTELTEDQFTALVKRRHPQQADIWLGELKRQGHLLGYIHVHELIQGQANEVYFEVSKESIGSTFHQVIRLSGINIDGDNARLRSSSQGIRGALRKRSLNCWVSEQNSFTLSETKRLPPLFELYPLHALLPNGQPRLWTIAFGQNAFFMEGVIPQRRLTTLRTDGTAIIL